MVKLYPSTTYAISLSVVKAVTVPLLSTSGNSTWELSLMTLKYSIRPSASTSPKQTPTHRGFPVQIKMKSLLSRKQSLEG